MAVVIDVEAFRESISEEVATAADRLLDAGEVGDLESVGGGARAVVADGEARFQPWVGVVDSAFDCDCDCAERPGEDDFCVHAVAVALAAFDAGVPFSAVGVPHGAGPGEPRPSDLQRAVRALSPRQLTDLVVAEAMRDRRFATLLLAEAGLLGPVDDASGAGFEAVIREVAAVTTGNRWEIADVENAGHRLLAEAEILCARPAAPAMLDLIEEAIEVWDELAGHLIDAYDVRRTDPEEISEPLADAHRDLCERLALGPHEVAARLTRLLDRCDNDPVDPAGYAHLLDPAGLAAPG